MAKKKYIRGTKLKAPMYSPVFRSVEKAKRETPSKPPPGRRPREYDLNRLDRGGTNVGGIWELFLAPFEALSHLAEEVKERAQAELLEKPGLEDEILDLRTLLESDQITVEEYQRRERELRTKYEKR